MSPKVEAPFVGTEVDTSDPSGTVKNIILGIVAVALALAMFAGGQSLYNAVAENTPDAVSTVEVL